MDNNEITPQGEADVTASSGQSEEVTQPVESAESVDGGQVEETGKSTYPWEEDERFKGKTPDQIYKQIQEAEKLKGELSQKAKLINKLEQTTGMRYDQIEAELANQEKQKQRDYFVVHYCCYKNSQNIDEFNSRVQVVYG